MRVFSIIILYYFLILPFQVKALEAVGPKLDPSLTTETPSEDKKNTDLPYQINSESESQDQTQDSEASKEKTILTQENKSPEEETEPETPKKEAVYIYLSSKTIETKAADDPEF